MIGIFQIRGPISTGPVLEGFKWERNTRFITSEVSPPRPSPNRSWLRKEAGGFGGDADTLIETIASGTGKN